MPEWKNLLTSLGLYQHSNRTEEVELIATPNSKQHQIQQKIDERRQIQAIYNRCAAQLLTDNPEKHHALYPNQATCQTGNKINYFHFVLLQKNHRHLSFCKMIQDEIDDLAERQQQYRRRST